MAMCQINQRVPILTYVVDKNTVADDLIHFICKANRDGFLSQGDFLVMDNCRIHNSSSIRERLLELMSEMGFRIVFLPTYSPELNPIEFLFGVIKKKIRNTLHDGAVFYDVVARSFATITASMVENCYSHTILRTEKIN